MSVQFGYLAAPYWKFLNSLQKWFSMVYVVFPSVKHANFVNLFSATRKCQTYITNYRGVNYTLGLMGIMTLYFFDCMKA